MHENLHTTVRGRWDRSPVNVERLCVEMGSVLDKHACFVAEIDSGRTLERLISFGGNDR